MALHNITITLDDTLQDNLALVQQVSGLPLESIIDVSIRIMLSLAPDDLLAMLTFYKAGIFEQIEPHLSGFLASVALSEFLEVKGVIFEKTTYPNRDSGDQGNSPLFPNDVE